ncbi:MAG TPA: ABC transporter ATP-binding protein [Candidatus Binatia bacterium]
MLEVKNLDLFYGEAQALAGVSLEVSKGEIVSIIGSNGAGKSSLIRTIAGLERPHAGEIRFTGRQISGLEPHQICNLGLGHVPEGRQIFPSLTTMENLALGAMLSRAHAQAKQTSSEVFTLFPILAERKKQVAGTLSGGEQQMLAIGRCLMSRPELIMLDEPSLGLAPAVVNTLLQAIRAVKERGVTILLVEQNVALSLEMSERAYVLENGRMVLSGSGKELLTDSRVRRAYLGM